MILNHRVPYALSGVAHGTKVRTASEVEARKNNRYLVQVTNIRGGVNGAVRVSDEIQAF